MERILLINTYVVVPILIGIIIGIFVGMFATVKYIKRRK
ncbi:putative membrane protein [Vibrio parahaemolyticus VPCR-2009]|nr:putative membrane protein [Vibrio parahaemolyticus VPCR-2009]